MFEIKQHLDKGNSGIVCADLHMHSTWSDGSLSPAELIRFGRNQGLRVMAVTDHDTLEGQAEVEEEGRKQGMEIITGLEISAWNPDTGRKVHILGYQIQDRNTVNKVLRPYLEDRNQAACEAVKKIREEGYSISLSDAMGYTGKGGILYRQHIMHALADRGYALSIYGPLYQKLFGPRGLARINSAYISVFDAVRLIVSCGGIPVLAHPFQYDSMDLVPKLAELGLQGIECCHPTQTPQRQKAVRETAAVYGLFLTGGSDSHGLYSEKPVPAGSMEFSMGADHPLRLAGSKWKK